jgi:hypothetical protein
MSGNLLLIAGTGRNSGKTTLACQIIEQFRHLGIISIKISPHLYMPTDGLILVSEKYCPSGYLIYEETNPESSKDSSRMLKCGAAKVYFVQSKEEFINEAFSEIIENISEKTPVICESQTLRNYIEPGAFILMGPGTEDHSKNTDHMIRYTHINLSLEDLQRMRSLPFDFKDGMWNYLKDNE